MLKKFTFWVLVVCFLVAVSTMSRAEIKRKGAGAVEDYGVLKGYGPTKDYRIEILEPNHIICVELVFKEVPVRARVEELGEYTSSVEIFKQAIKEVSKEYNIYSACPITESAYPSVFGTWTKTLILFVEPKNK